MSRRRKRKSNTEDTSSEETSAKPQASNSSAESLMLKSVGYTRAPIAYSFNNRFQVPPVIFRAVCPFAAIRGGFRLTSEDSTNDTTVSQVGWDPEGIDGTSYFHPRIGMKSEMDAHSFEAATPLADRFVRLVWPYYDRLFRQSVKQSGSEVPFNAFLAISAMLMEAQSLLLDAKHLMHLGDGVGIKLWDDAAHLFGQGYRLYNRQLTRRVENAINLIGAFPAPRGLANEISRIKSPFISSIGRGTLFVPLEYMLPSTEVTRSSTSTHVEDLLTRVELIATVIRSEYSDEIAAMKRHMPYTLADSQFIASIPPVIDPFKTDGYVNATPITTNVSGNEGDTDDSARIVMTTDARDVGFLGSNLKRSAQSGMIQKIHTVFPDFIPFGSVMSSRIYVADSDVTDKEFALLTPHNIGTILIPGTNTTLDGIEYVEFTDVGVTSDQSHLIDPMLMQYTEIAGTAAFVPDAVEVNLDLDEIIKCLDYTLVRLYDTGTVGTIDVLGQTAGAPVTHPAVASAR